MTREEAIDIIKCLAWHARPDEEDVEQAIKALEQEPCEDCVSRAEVMNMAGLYADWFESSDSYNDFVAELYNLPSVTPIHRDRTVQDFVDKCRECGARYGRLLKQKKGKWINKSQKSGCGITFIASECTCCGKKTFFNCDELIYSYCPNCGAEMESE